jgi:RimJ/RimL family protein N-acetyltransferase
MVLVGEHEDQAAGSICIWESEHDGRKVNEIGWMILPEFQGQGINTKAVRTLLDRGRAEKRWDIIHAYPATRNLASNAVCRKVGFTLAGELDFNYSGRLLHCNDWQIDLLATK